MAPARRSANRLGTVAVWFAGWAARFPWPLAGDLPSANVDLATKIYTYVMKRFLRGNMAYISWNDGVMLSRTSQVGRLATSTGSFNAIG